MNILVLGLVQMGFFGFEEVDSDFLDYPEEALDTLDCFEGSLDFGGDF